MVIRVVRLCGRDEYITECHYTALISIWWPDTTAKLRIRRPDTIALIILGLSDTVAGRPDNATEMCFVSNVTEAIYEVREA